MFARLQFDSQGLTQTRPRAPAMQVSSLMVASDAEGSPSAISSIYFGIFSFVGQALMHGAVTETRYACAALHPLRHGGVKGLPEIGEGRPGAGSGRSVLSGIWTLP